MVCCDKHTQMYRDSQTTTARLWDRQRDGYTDSTSCQESTQPDTHSHRQTLKLVIGHKLAHCCTGETHDSDVLSAWAHAGPADHRQTH